MNKLLIKNTTKEQRIKLIEDGLAFAGIENDSDISVDDFNDYINGKKELQQLYLEILEM